MQRLAAKIAKAAQYFGYTEVSLLLLSFFLLNLLS